MTLIATVATAAAGCAQKQADFKYTVDQFADVKIIRYTIPGWDELTLNQKAYAYHLSEAAKWGRDILWEQNCCHNMQLRHALEDILNNYKGDRKGEDWQAFELYAKRVFFANGIHHHYAEDKIFPTCSEDYFKSLLDAVGRSDEAEVLLPYAFDPNLYPQRRCTSSEGDIVAQSGVNYYEGVTREEVEAYYASIEDKNDPTPIAYGLNTKLVKENGKVVEKPWKKDGLCGKALAVLTEAVTARTGRDGGTTTSHVLPLERVGGEPVAKILDGCALGVKEQSEIVRSAGRAAQMMGLSACAQELAAAYARYFTAKPERSLAVRFAEKPIRCIADWRAIRESLPKGVCDLPFGADVEALVTDVNTQRTIVEKGEGDNLAAQMEVSFVCDRAALHLFLRVADKDARKVEHGFTNGIGTEMYFAPGENQPYLCFGTSPRTGLDTFAFQTAYSNRDSHRLNVKGALDRNSVRSEVEFTDSDYVTRIFFPWDAFYQKLPVRAGDYWKLDFLCWGTKTSWGGSQGVHESSSWGHLVFNLKDEEVTAIRKRLILRTYKNWKGAKHGEVDVFDRWADPVLGDPAFYAARLKPLEAELAGYAKRVTPEMTDADVTDIFVHALPRWMGLKYEVDALRGRQLVVKQTDNDPNPIAGRCDGVMPDGTLLVAGRSIWAGEAHVLS